MKYTKRAYSRARFCDPPSSMDETIGVTARKHFYIPYGVGSFLYLPIYKVNLGFYILHTYKQGGWGGGSILPYRPIYTRTLYTRKNLKSLLIDEFPLNSGGLILIDCGVCIG